ncbi:MAG: peptide deformylase [Coxiellaceae bacterium]|nr:peptide deformylase [Coxiellaceae bacterium]
MTILRILQYPDLRLKTKGYTVKDFGAETQKIIDDMFETHYAAENCAALAATQLDIDPPPHITVIDFSPEKNQPFCIVNGQVIARDGETNTEEGCMSVGGGDGSGPYEKVKRAEKITVKGQNRHGEDFEMEADGFMAKCIQHELDHLEGRIFLDHLSGLKKKRVDKKIGRMK